MFQCRRERKKGREGRNGDGRDWARLMDGRSVEKAKGQERGNVTSSDVLNAGISGAGSR